MRRLALVAVVLLLIAWHTPSPRKMVAAQPSSMYPSPPPSDDPDDDDQPARGLQPPSDDRDDYRDDDPPAHGLVPPSDEQDDDPPAHSLPSPPDEHDDDPPAHSLPSPPDEHDDGPPAHTPPPTDDQDNPPVHSLPPPREDEDNDPPRPGHHLSPPPPPPDEFNAPQTPLPKSPPLPEPATPPPTPPPPPQEVPPPPRHDDPSAPEPTEPPHLGHEPRREPRPPRTVVPPQEPGWAAVPLPLPPPPASPAVINYTTTSYTTMLVFGDSTVDPGNNNRLQTAMKANFLPYGTSFLGGRPTGRFSNGRLITDILAERLGIAMSIPGFHEPRLRPRQLRRGVSFASAGSGYDDATARISNALSFSNQVEDLWRYKRNLQRLVGPRRAEQLVRRATFIISAGTTDVLFHYLASNRSVVDSWPQYESLLVTRISNYTQVMRTLGGRRFVFVGVPPVGCLPIARTLLGTGSETCHESMNLLATSFNKRLAELVRLLRNEQDTRATFVDIYTIIGMATVDPKTFGLTETSRGCCGTGIIEVGQACRGRITCTDPSKYMYWDAAHQTERMNQIITDHAIMNSIGEIYV